MGTPTTKVCTKCKEEKALSEFHTLKRGKYGLNPACKKCKSEYSRLRNATPESQARNRQYRKDNAEVRRERNREWARRNYASIQDWRARNPEKVREYARNWNKKNPEVCKRNSAKWKADNPEKQAGVVLRSKPRKNLRTRANRANLTDGYIADLLGLSVNDAPPELIEAKRIHLKIHRLLRSMK